MDQPTVPYTRAVRLALEEKRGAYRLQEVDTLSGEARSPNTSRAIPGERFKLLEHDGVARFETVAVTRYVNEGFPGLSLQPGGARQRTRMAQIVRCSTTTVGYRW